MNQALAEYLPSQDDPRYLHFERKLPEYRKKMEADFPQVCETCAPAVEDRIRSTGYAAKTDHLRRMMNRTRGAGIKFNSWTWKRLGGILGTIGWSAGLLGQLCSNSFGALPLTHPDDGCAIYEKPQSIATCLMTGIFDFQSTCSCNELVQPMLAITLILSLLFFWWNPRMLYKLRGGYGRIVGHFEYYKLQLIALVIRYMAWKLVAKDSTFHLDFQATRALHAFSLVIGIIVSPPLTLATLILTIFQLTVLSFHAIRIDQQPLVSFQENYEPLVPPVSDQHTASTIRQTRRDPSPPRRRRVEPFPIEKLAPKPQQPVYQPPTPPPEEDSEDYMMEWSPQHNFKPVSTYRSQQHKPAYKGPSPFHGVLPPAPISWAQRLRNPPSQPAFQKASEAKKENFFGKKNQRVVSDAVSDTTSPAHSVTQNSMFDIDSPVKFAPPRFFAPVDRMETGLESLFSSAFSLGKEQSSNSFRGPPDTELTVSALPPKSTPRLIATVLLGASLLAWSGAKLQNLVPPDSVQIFSIIIAGLNALYNLSLAIPRADRNLSYIVLQLLELLIDAAFVRVISITSSLEKEWPTAKFGLWYLMALTIQEVWSYVSSPNAPPAVAPAETPKPFTQDTKAPTRRAQAPKELSKRLAGTNSKGNDSAASYTRARPDNNQLNQRTLRAKTRNEVRRDSLGVDRLGGLSLGDGW